MPLPPGPACPRLFEPNRPLERVIHLVRGELRHEGILPVRLETHLDDLAVRRVRDALELLDRPVEPAHEEEANGHAVGHHDHVFGEVGLGEVSVEGVEEGGHAVVHIGAGLAVGNAVIEHPVGVAGRVDELAFLLGAKVSPLLLADARIFAPRNLRAIELGAYAFKGLARAKERGDVEEGLFVFDEGFDFLAGLGGLLPPFFGELKGVIGLAAVHGFIDVPFGFAVADKEDAVGFQRRPPDQRFC